MRAGPAKETQNRSSFRARGVINLAFQEKGQVPLLLEESHLEYSVDLIQGANKRLLFFTPPLEEDIGGGGGNPGTLHGVRQIRKGIFSKTYGARRFHGKISQPKERDHYRIKRNHVFELSPTKGDEIWKGQGVPKHHSHRKILALKEGGKLQDRLNLAHPQTRPSLLLHPSSAPILDGEGHWHSFFHLRGGEKDDDDKGASLGEEVKIGNGEGIYL